MPPAAALLLAAVVQTAHDLPPVRSPRDHEAAPVVRAGRAGGPIRVDARLDEPEWAAAAVASDFIQLDPHEGAPASERTEVRILVDGDALYVGARLFDAEPAKIKAALARRDAPVDSDLFEVYLDTYHDHLSAVVFRINPAGAIRDAVVGAHRQDGSWDPVWEYAARVDSLGWVAELRIPLSQLRFNPQEQAVWGIQFGRLIFRKGEISFWSPVLKTQTFDVNTYGHLVGLGAVEPARRLEVLPYTLGRAEYAQVAAGNPFRDGSDYFADAGFDVKYGITSDFTLDLTVNPDFGQVEVDPAVVNLSAFETFFQEKRPFFVEGAEVFSFGDIRSFNHSGFPRFFFSRRIGRSPQHRPVGPGVNFPDVPSQTTIHAAAKVTGRTSSGWSLGFLEALTAMEEGRYIDSLGVGQRAAVEPLSNYAVGRLRRDLRSGNTSVGGMVTSVHRNLGEPALERLLTASAYMAGLDFKHAWRNREWSLDGAVALSSVRGSDAALRRVQRSSARYFQRPGARQARFNPGRTALDGYAFQISLAKNSGVHWLGSLTYQETSPGFEVNDLGFQAQADRRALAWTYGFQETKPGRVFRSFSIFPFANHVWNFDGDLVFGSFGIVSFMHLANFWQLFVRGDLAPPAYDDKLTRGGPVARRPANRDVVLSLSTDSRKQTRGEFETFYGWDEAGGWNWNTALFFSTRPTTASRITLGPRLSRRHAAAQYVTAVSDTGAIRTFGSRYVFGALEQTELSLVARVDWTFTPRLSLQLFLQPLLSANEFGDIKELRAPRSFAFDVYGRDRGTVTDSAGIVIVDPGDGGAPFRIADPTFNFRSLRANAVLRWEWRPGSTVFLVWQHRREDQAGVGDFDLGRDLSMLRRADGDNVLAVKVSYWLGL